MKEFYLVFLFTLLVVSSNAQESYDYIGIGHLKIEAGYEPDISTFDWALLNKDHPKVHTRLFINPDRMVQVQTYTENPKSFLFYDLNRKDNQLSIYIDSVKLKIRSEIEGKRSAFDVIPDQFASELNDSLQQDLTQKLAGTENKKYIIDSTGIELLPGYFCDKYKLKYSGSSHQKEIYLWVLKDALTLSDFIEEDLPDISGVILKSYFKNRYFTKRYGVVEFEENVSIPELYILNKDEYELKSWKELNNYLK